MVEVAVDRVFQARCSDSEIECFLVVCRISQQTIDQTTHERVTAAYTVNDMCNVITTRLVQFAVGIKNTAPCIVVGIDSAAQCDDHFLCTREFGHQLCTYGFELGCIHLAVCCCHVKAFRFDAEYLFCILFVS